MYEALHQQKVLHALKNGQKEDTFLGNAIEIAMVTRDYKKTIRGLTQVGIGPWRVYDFTPSNTTSQMYQGKDCEFELKVCFAQSGNMVWEVIQPISGPTIFEDFLQLHGEGIHHIAYDCLNVPFDERIAEMRRRGFDVTQSGSWMGTCHFAFFSTEAATGTCIETYMFPSDWIYPEPVEWYPPIDTPAPPALSDDPSRT